MSDDPNRAIIEAWARATTTGDHETIRRLAHPDLTLEWPASGERMRGIDRVLAVDQAYPGHPTAELRRVVGAEERWVVDAMLKPRRIVGSGDVWVVEATMTYPDDAVWEYVAVIELQDGRVRAETDYYAPRIEPPAWRDGLTERTR
jgi:hypothetical protein